MPQGSDVGGLQLRFEKRWRFRWETQTPHGSSEERVVVFTWGNERTASQRWNLNSVIFIQLFDHWKKILFGIYYVASSVSGTGATVVKRLDWALPYWSWVRMGRISGAKGGPLQTRPAGLRNVIWFNAGHCGDIQRTTSLIMCWFSFNRLMSLPKHTH